MIHPCNNAAVTAPTDSGVIEKIKQHAIAGTVGSFLNLADDQPLPSFDDDDAWANATVTADDLAEILTSPGLTRHRKGVRLAGLRIVGDLDLEEARLDRFLMLRRCQFGPSSILLANAETRGISLSGSACGGVFADGASITGSVFLDEGFKATGEVSLIGAKIDGQLNCQGATLSNATGRALSADGVSITGGVFLTEGFKATGEVRLLGAQIRGQLSCQGATLANAKGYALIADGVSTTGHVILNRGLNTTGEISLIGAKIDGQLNCQGATLSNAKGPALSADGASITGGVFLTEGFNAAGEVRLLGAQIGRSLSCRDATLANAKGPALSVDKASITGDVFLDGGFNAAGEVRLLGAQIGRSLSCRDATLANAKGPALNTDGASITDGVFLDGGFKATGMVSFVNARAGALVDSKANWPTEMQIDGFRYDALHSDAEGWKDRGEWLRRQVTPSPGSYLQLAAVYRARGDDVDARKILMERHSELIRRNRPERWQPHYPRRRTRSWRRFLGVTIGHGYEPWRALYFLLPLLVAMAAWYARADGQDLLVPNDQVRNVASSRCTSDYPCVQPLVYAADTLIPLVDLGQRSKWTPGVTARGPSRYFFDDGRWLATATWVANVLGWIFATLIIAGFSNVIRKE